MRSMGSDEGFVIVACVVPAAVVGCACTLKNIGSLLPSLRRTRGPGAPHPIRPPCRRARRPLPADLILFDRAAAATRFALPRPRCLLTALEGGP